MEAWEGLQRREKTANLFSFAACRREFWPVIRLQDALHSPDSPCNAARQAVRFSGMLQIDCVQIAGKGGRKAVSLEGSHSFFAANDLAHLEHSLSDEARPVGQGNCLQCRGQFNLATLLLSEISKSNAQGCRGADLASQPTARQTLFSTIGLHADRATSAGSLDLVAWYVSIGILENPR